MNMALHKYRLISSYCVIDSQIINCRQQTCLCFTSYFRAFPAELGTLVGKIRKVVIAPTSCLRQVLGAVQSP